MARLNSFLRLAVAFALSNLVTASPLVLPRQTTVPGNVASGTVTAGCALFHTVAPGETCFLLEQEFGISDAAFHMLNPEVNSACTNLLAGEAYCVKAATAVTPPPNVAPGTITAGCTQFFTVQSGQTCQTIETMFGTTLAAFLALNPEVNVQCTNLIAGEAYCVQSTSS